MPVIETATSAPKRSSAPIGHRLGHLGADRAVRLDQVGRGDAEELDLGGIGVADDPAGEVLRGARAGR